MAESYTILMIEEDASLRFMMREIARALDLQVEIANSCAEGVQWLQACPSRFALLILSLNLCDVGSDKTVLSVRRDGNIEVRDIPIIGMLEQNAAADPNLIESARINDCLRKPVTPAELLTLVDRYATPVEMQK